MMTSRERILAVLRGELPDCLPVCPDISNMVPARLTGKPFWDVYLHQDPPLWKAYIDAVKQFDIDGGFELYLFGDLFGDEGLEDWSKKIIRRNDDGSMVTRDLNLETGEWDRYVEVYTADNPPAAWVKPETIGLPEVPSDWEEISSVKPWPTGMELWKLIKKEMGDSGVVGMPSGMSTLVLEGADESCDFYDDPQPFYDRRDQMMDRVRNRIKIIAELDDKPDFLFCGGSGSLVFQTPETFRELALPPLKLAAELAAEQGIPTHVHSCGPAAELVRMAVEETQLTIIDPLEPPPMGNCDLAELKKKYGDRIVLKGNLHTTNIMLHGSVDEVVAAAKQAIDDAGKGGGFILSSADQCGRDTPDENLHALVETARTHGKY